MPPDPGLQGVWCPTRFHLGLLWHPDDVGLRAVLEVLLPWMQVLPENSPQGSMSLTYLLSCLARIHTSIGHGLAVASLHLPGFSWTWVLIHNGYLS